ncbi:hypothetical protein CYMTET_42272 [Cymbomonas tetramitiformis]|uniref:Nucleotide-diphospho-sugar transferase domain-containing protein n=1 Tax=Cymbomonas tetramitiformis TaxID=36881 RepID=A0AAE0C4G5_9CHLO|nr:hypothetical protein CYMTET_42272 [Cymbomonas tetramitiformis]
MIPTRHRTYLVYAAALYMLAFSARGLAEETDTSRCPLIYATYLVAPGNLTDKSTKQHEMLCLWAESIRRVADETDLVVWVTDTDTDPYVECPELNITRVAVPHTRYGTIGRFEAFHGMLQTNITAGKCVVGMDTDMLVLRSMHDAFHDAHFDFGLTWRRTNVNPIRDKYMPINGGIWFLPLNSKVQMYLFSTFAEHFKANYMHDFFLGDQKVYRDLLMLRENPLPLSSDLEVNRKVWISTVTELSANSTSQGQVFAARALRQFSKQRKVAFRLYPARIYNHFPPLKADEMTVYNVHFKGPLKGCMELYMQNLRAAQPLQQKDEYIRGAGDEVKRCANPSKPLKLRSSPGKTSKEQMRSKKESQQPPDANLKREISSNADSSLNLKTSRSKVTRGKKIDQRTLMWAQYS